MGNRAQVFQEDYLCNQFSYILTYNPDPAMGIRVVLIYFDPYVPMKIEDLMGMANAIKRFHRRILEL